MWRGPDCMRSESPWRYHTTHRHLLRRSEGPTGDFSVFWSGRGLWLLLKGKRSVGKRAGRPLSTHEDHVKPPHLWTHGVNSCLVLMQRLTLIHLDPDSWRQLCSYCVGELLLEIAWCSSTCFYYLPFQMKYSPTRAGFTRWWATGQEVSCGHPTESPRVLQLSLVIS